MAYGTANALVADLVPENLRGTAYGTYNAVIGILAFPASVIAGVLWQGVGAWQGFGPSAPFLFGGTLALIGCPADGLLAAAGAARPIPLFSPFPIGKGDGGLG